MQHNAQDTWNQMANNIRLAAQLLTERISYAAIPKCETEVGAWKCVADLSQAHDLARQILEAYAPHLVKRDGSIRQITKYLVKRDGSIRQITK